MLLGRRGQAIADASDGGKGVCVIRAAQLAKYV
jgi:hypothetical protein